MDAPTRVPPGPKVETIIADINQLMAEAEQMLNDSSSQHAEDQIRLLHTRFDTMRERLAACVDGAGRALAVGVRHTDQAIRAKPYQALAVALGAGLVIGALLSRRSE